MYGKRFARENNNVPGVLGCKFCRGTKGTFERRGNRFICATPKCKGARTPMEIMKDIQEGLNDTE